MTNESAMFQAIDSLVDLEEARIWLRVMDGQRQGWRNRALEAEARLSESRSSTAVETADERCAKCGHDRRGVIHDERWVKADGSGHPFKPVEEPVSPPSPDEHCGCEGFTTCRWCSHPLKAHAHRWCSMCHEELRLRRPRWKANAPAADHLFGCPHGTPIRDLDDGGSDSLPLQEGGGWRRRGEEGEYVLWMDEDRQALVPLAVEEAIRAEAEARATHAEGVAEAFKAGLDEAQEERDKYRTALADVRRTAAQNGGAGARMLSGYSTVYSIADRALATQDDREEGR